VVFLGLRPLPLCDRLPSRGGQALEGIGDAGELGMRVLEQIANAAALASGSARSVA
jgi:hypothetical protein